MKSDDSYAKFQDSVFQQLDDMEQVEEQRRFDNTVDKLLKKAQANGFSISDMQKMLGSGMTFSQIIREVVKRGKLLKKAQANGFFLYDVKEMIDSGMTHNQIVERVGKRNPAPPRNAEGYYVIGQQPGHRSSNNVAPYSECSTAPNKAAKQE